MSAFSRLKSFTLFSKRAARTNGRRTDRRQRSTSRLIVEPLEDRTVPSLDFGLAFGFGGTAGEVGRAVTTDGNGNLYPAGYFSSPTLDADPGPDSYLLTNAGESRYRQFFVGKYSATGGLLWAQGVTTNAQAGDDADIAVDASGNVYVTGGFRGSAGFGGITLTSQGDGDVFLAKLDAAGNFLWATRMGSADDPFPSYEYGSGLALDDSGNVYTTGWFSATGSASGIFVSQHDSNGNLVWLKDVAGGGLHSVDLARDASGNLYMTGSYRGAVDFDPGPGTYKLTSVKASPFEYSNDVFVLKLDAGGNFVWAGSMGGKGSDWGQAVAVDGSGSVHITGNFDPDTRNDFDPGKNRVTLPNAGQGDIFVVKLDSNRNLLWARSMGGPGHDIGHGIDVDGSGSVYTAGQFWGTADFDPGSGTFNLTSAGNYDVFVSQLSSAGNFAWVGRMGGAGDDRAWDLALDGSGNVYTAGSFVGTADFDPGPGEHLLTSTPDSNGNPTRDVFVSKLVPSSGLLAAGGQTTSSSPPLTERQTDLLLAEAITRWQAAGADISGLGTIDARIVDLPGALLGQASGNTIWLDDNAAGRGWFVDPTPWDDSEFTTPGNQGEKRRIDLLTVIAHEVGHLLGFDHEENGVMAETLSPGTRLGPGVSAADELMAALMEVDHAKKRR